jgi:hypothetical protein
MDRLIPWARLEAVTIVELYYIKAGEARCLTGMAVLA